MKTFVDPKSGRIFFGMCEEDVRVVLDALSMAKWEPEVEEDFRDSCREVRRRLSGLRTRTLHHLARHNIGARL